MENFVAVVFGTDKQAAEGLHALWQLNENGAVKVFSAAVIARDRDGKIRVVTKRTDPAPRTAAGLALGALLGAIVGPAGAALGIGAAAGGLLGSAGDALEADARGQAVREAGSRMADGDFAVLAEVDEDLPTLLDRAMTKLGGTVYRRAKGSVSNDSLGDSNYADELVPHDYQPHFTKST